MNPMSGTADIPEAMRPQPARRMVAVRLGPKDHYRTHAATPFFAPVDGKPFTHRIVYDLPCMGEHGKAIGAAPVLQIAPIDCRRCLKMAWVKAILAGVVVACLCACGGPAFEPEHGPDASADAFADFKPPSGEPTGLDAATDGPCTGPPDGHGSRPCLFSGQPGWSDCHCSSCDPGTCQ